MKVKLKFSLIILLVVSQIFLVLPWLGVSDKPTKIYSFIYISIAFSFVSVYRINKIYVSKLYTLYLLINFLFFFFSYFSYCRFSSSLTSGFIFLALVFHFLLVDYLRNNPCFRIKIIDCLLLLGVIAAALGLYEYFSYVNLGQSKSMLIPYLLPADRSSRIGGMFGQPNLFALFLTIVCIGFIFRHVHTNFSPKSWFLCTIRFLPFFMVCLAFFLTGSRAGFLSFSFVIAFLSWLVVSGRYLLAPSENKKDFFLLLINIGLAFMVSKLLSLGGPEGRALSAVGISTDARFIFWTSAFLMFFDAPLVGNGLSSYGLLQNSYNPLAHKILGFVQYEAMGNTNWAHNELLQILAEGGIFLFILVSALLFLYFKGLIFKSVSIEKSSQYFHFYSYLLIFPFIVQSMFSWVFRYPPLFILFMILASILISQNELALMPLGKLKKISIYLSLLIALSIGSFFMKDEVRINNFSRDIRYSRDVSLLFDDYSALANLNYSSYLILSRYTARFVANAIKNNNSQLALNVLPYAKRLTQLEGSGEQWYNLAQLYLFLNERHKAEAAINEAINMLPHKNRLWDFLHYLNILKAVDATGKPIETFLPLPEGQPLDVDTYLENFNVSGQLR